MLFCLLSIYLHPLEVLLMNKPKTLLQFFQVTLMRFDFHMPKYPNAASMIRSAM